MTPFYEIIKSLDASRIKTNLPKITTGQVRALLESISSGTIPNPEDIAILVSPAAAELLEPMAQLAKTITARRFGKTIQMYAPLYVSNYCSNSCLYCGFNVHNKVDRRTSSREEMLTEARLLKNKHISQLLLVSGECPAEVSLDMLEESPATSKGFSLRFQSKYIRWIPKAIPSFTGPA